MSKWHKEILVQGQTELLSAVKPFSKDFGLVGGTAVALHIGHRESIDFDLFTKKPDYDFDIPTLKRRFKRHAFIDTVIREKGSEFTFKARGVQVTFYHFEYRIPYTERFGSYIAMPSLLTLAAMKAFALGQRAKWKDYVDMYFILREYHTLAEIVWHTEKLFGNEFNSRLLREQLSYFDDINYAEPVVFKPGFEVPDEKIKRALEEYSIS
ncbi:MAG: nucleotidyl transferase AbiEii/AbiGii toxin family protein [bacterium]|nr:nucleotidyl transferase AbiEii/AbiGii toxin family protein [bacterium]